MKKVGEVSGRPEVSPWTLVGRTSIEQIRLGWPSCIVSLLKKGGPASMKMMWGLEGRFDLINWFVWRLTCDTRALSGQP